MLKFVALFLCVLTLVNSRNWQSSSYVLDHEQFFTSVLQETILELERREWCNMKLLNIYQTIRPVDLNEDFCLNIHQSCRDHEYSRNNRQRGYCAWADYLKYDSLYNFLVHGTVIYRNGFLISIQKINVVNIIQSVSARTVDNITTHYGSVQGSLNLNDVLVGFDVEANLNSNGVVSLQRYTGTYNYGLIQLQIVIQKNLHTDEISVSSSLLSLSGGSGVRMIFMPSNNVTEALSRRWVPGDNWNGVLRWGSEHITPTILNIVNTQISFPDICLGCY